MTNEEALAILKNEMPSCGKKLVFAEGEKTEAYNMAISLIEKQIAKKPNYIPYPGLGNCCASCGRWLSDHYSFCHFCGQKLDWTKGK